MSVPTDSPSDATSALGTPELQRWVDAYVQGSCSATTLNRSLTALCRDNPGVASDALSLLARYDEEGHLRLRNLEVLRARLESAARGESSSAPDVVAHPDAPHLAAATELLPVAEAASATVLLPIAGAAPATEVMPASLQLDSSVTTSARLNERPSPARVVAPIPRGPTRRPIGPGSVLRERYVLEEPLGSGGMGTVYRALDRNRLDLAYESRYVALKVLRPEYSRRPEAVAALRREFLQAQSLTHPGLVKVFDFDRDGDTHFITMELLDGELLSRLIERLRPGKLPKDDARRILGALGSAVAHAHEHGVLHLDLKPGNVMITAADEVRVLDFGLAHPHVREPWISDGPPAFHAATPTYASCERIAGTSPDARDDVFSLACIAYELLSGEHPFNRSPAREARDEGLKIRRIRGLSRRQWQTLRRGLAWAREDRVRSVAELLEGLGLETAAPRSRSPARPVRTESNASGALGGLLFGALVVAAVVLYLQRERWLPLVATVWPAVTTKATTDGEPAKIPEATAVQDASPASIEPALTPDAALAVVPTPEAAADTASDTGTAAPVRRGTEAAVSPGQTAAGHSDATPSASDDRSISLATVLPGGTPQVGAQPEPPPAAVENAVQQAVPAAPAPATPRRRGRVQLVADSMTVSESEPAARVKVRRVGGSDGRLSFLWRTDGHSATGDKDYAELGWNEEVLGPGQVSATLLVPIVADQQREHTELFDVVLGTTEDDTVLGTITSTTVILVDDD
jgi:hypothetical protein